MNKIKWRKHEGFYFAFIIYLISKLIITKGSIAYLVYYDYIYTNIRSFSSLITALLPFATIYIILPLVLLLIGLYWIRSSGYSSVWFERTRKLLNIAGVWYAMFYVLWGFNYEGAPIKERLGFQEINVDSLSIYAELSLVSTELNKMRLSISADTAPFLPRQNSYQIEKIVNQIYNQELPKLGYKAFSNTRVKPLYPAGTLLCISTAGVYVPYTFEGHFDPGLHSLQLPFTIAHEMAHVYGVTDEGECNFLAYLACRQSSDPIVQYSALLGYWRYLFAEARFLNEEKSGNFYKTLHISVRNDLTSISRNLDSFPDYFPVLRNAIYDYYLRSNGVLNGLESYNEMIALIIESKKHEPLIAFQKLE